MKRKKFILLGALSLIFALIGSTWAQEENDDLKHVRKASEKYRASLKKGNWEQVFAMYTKHAVKMPPNRILSKGKKAAKEGWLKAKYLHFEFVDWQEVEFTISGDVAFEIATYSVKFQTEGYDEPTVGPPYKLIHVWKKQADGSWKLHLDMWSANQPSSET